MVSKHIYVKRFVAKIGVINTYCQGVIIGSETVRFRPLKKGPFFDVPRNSVRSSCAVDMCLFFFFFFRGGWGV